MRRLAPTLVGFAVLVGLGSTAWSHWSAGLASSATVAVQRSPFLPTPPLAGPRETVFYGRVVSLVRKGARYEARVDPALFLGGVTANRAAADDGVISPGDSVPNDHYVRDESHKLLTYLVPATAHVTMVGNSGSGIFAQPVSVAELAQIVKGKNPKHRPLFEPKNPFWIHVATDTVLSLDQQYSP
jgi:hypothetical protein